MEIAGAEMKTETVDHLGLIAGFCKELKLVEKLNVRLGPKNSSRIVSPGLGILAMILNGLGFTNRRLYLTPQFFENKAVEELLGAGIKAEHLNDDCLGKCLDGITEYGATRLFGEVALEVMIENKLLGKNANLDSTSFSFTGEYDNTEEEKSKEIHITYGFSKDHRPDLKQAMLAMVSTGPAEVPCWLEAQDGNSSDKEAFGQVAERVRAFHKQLSLDHEFLWVADSALYTKTNLELLNGCHWLTRVPEVINECKALVERPASEFQWCDYGNGYSYAEESSQYGGYLQRWLLVHSEQAYQREKKTFDKKLEKLKQTIETDCWHIGNQVFGCQLDAQKAVDDLQKKNQFFSIKSDINPVEKYAKRGKPSPEAKKVVTGFQVTLQIDQNIEAVKRYLNRKGRFILATNNLDKQDLSADKMLTSYKEQQGVERGFQFLKDPWFMADTFFVKKPSRVIALMVIMTLCLFVYKALQYKLRKSLETHEESVPNQIGKPTNRPTAKWIFQMFEGVSVVKFYDDAGICTRRIMTNLTEIRKKIIHLLGPPVCSVYGLG